MRPYRYRFLHPGKSLFFSFILVIVLGVTPAWACSPGNKGDFDALTQSGFEHFYSLQYDQAIHDFQKALEARPDEPKAINHLLEARLFQQLYKYNALDTRLYTKQRFLTSKQVPIEPSAKKQLAELTDQAMAASEKRLRNDPRDVQALYSRGVTEGLRSTYLAVAEHSFWSALKYALAARHDHEQVLKLQPDFSDAKTVVGAHNYVVGNLSLPVKAMAGIAGIRGDKNKGLQMLAEAGNAGGESSTDARVTLALFLRREERYPEAVDVVRTLSREHPHNFLFALEEGNLLRDAGRGPESIDVYKKLLNACAEGKYPEAHVEMAQFSLGEALRGQNQLPEALDAYRSAIGTSGYDPDLHQRALLAAGEVLDLMTKRQDALTEYRAAIAVDSGTEEAGIARKYLEKPYKTH
ncbi:MAG TPA: tetratricopeptide repeat protein [Candidatus Angelobacter sp.]|nr:tetratricopeptide repeat protein [Candidatus Angelobacter sp.]